MILLDQILARYRRQIALNVQRLNFTSQYIGLSAIFYIEPLPASALLIAPRLTSEPIERLDGRLGGVQAAVRRFTGKNNEPVNVISKSHRNRAASSMTALITTAKDGRLGADT